MESRVEDGYYHVFHEKDRVWRRVGGGEECDGNQGWRSKEGVFHWSGKHHLRLSMQAFEFEFN